MASHAYLAASASERWISCPPSAKLCAQMEDQGSPYAQEGTDAHSLCQYLLEQALGRHSRDPTDALTFYNAEMQEAAEGYAAFVMEQLAEVKQHCPDPLVCVEQTVDFSKWVEHGFGTADAAIVADGMLYVTDMKYGLGVLVSAAGEDGCGNTQLKCYALGAYLAFSTLYDIRNITLVIYQPRIANYSSFSLPTEALLAWADDVLRRSAALALAGEGELVCGSWCRFCKAKAVCRKRAEENLALARYDFARPPTLEDDEVNLILGRLSDLEAWAADIREYALRRALSGYAWDDFKLVESRSTRKITDEEAVVRVVEAAGFDPYEHKVKGITALSSMLGKNRFNELIGPFVEKQAGKPTLVPRADKRSELFVSASAEADFSSPA